MSDRPTPDDARAEDRMLRMRFGTLAEAPLVAATSMVDLRFRVQERRRRRRLAVGGISAAVLTLAVGTVLGAYADPARDRIVTTAERDSGAESSSPSTSQAQGARPDRYSRLGPCRSLLPTAFDPIEGSEAAPQATGDPVSSDRTMETAPQPPPEQVNTACSEALHDDLARRLEPIWRLRTASTGVSRSNEMSSPTGYGTAGASLTNTEGVVVQVRAGYGPPWMELTELVGWGEPVEGLPEGWVGVTSVVPERPSTLFKVTVAKPGALNVHVTVQQGLPGSEGGDGQPRSLLSYDEVKGLAVAIATDGPIASPA